MATPRLSGLALLLTMLAAQADELPPPAYQLAAHNAGIPSTVLFAIAQQESGLRVRDRLLPWPWTLNIAGSPYRFATREAACHALLQALARHPPKRVDAGLGQTNFGQALARHAEFCFAYRPVDAHELVAKIRRQPALAARRRQRRGRLRGQLTQCAMKPSECVQRDVQFGFFRVLVGHVLIMGGDLAVARGLRRTLIVGKRRLLMVAAGLIEFAAGMIGIKWAQQPTPAMALVLVLVVALLTRVKVRAGLPQGLSAFLARVTRFHLINLGNPRPGLSDSRGVIAQGLCEKCAQVVTQCGDTMTVSGVQRGHQRLPWSIECGGDRTCRREGFANEFCRGHTAAHKWQFSQRLV